MSKTPLTAQLSCRHAFSPCLQWCWFNVPKWNKLRTELFAEVNVVSALVVEIGSICNDTADNGDACNSEDSGSPRVHGGYEQLCNRARHAGCGSANVFSLSPSLHNVKESH